MVQNSCRITTEIELNIASMQFKNIPAQYNNSTWGIGFELPFTINVGGNGVVYKGKWIYQKSSGTLFCFMENVKNLNVIEKGSPDICWTNGNSQHKNFKYFFYYNIGQVTSVLRKFSISFDPANNINQEEMLNEKIEEYLKILGPFKPTNKIVTIICETQNFSFDQSWLAKISTVFSEMFESCDVGNAEFKVEGDKPESFTTLKNLFEKKTIKVEDITLDLALFANKYVLLVCTPRRSTTLRDAP